MNDHAEVDEWSVRLEGLLREKGLIDANGEAVAGDRGNLPVQIAAMLDGFVENINELNGLLKIGRAARQGEPLSDTVLSAAGLMMREVCLALQDAANSEEALPPKEPECQ